MELCTERIKEEESTALDESNMILKDLAKRKALIFNELKQELRKRLGPKKITQDQTDRLDYMKIRKNNLDLVYNFMELDSDWETDWRTQYYLGVSKLRETTIPNLKTLQILDSKVTKNRAGYRSYQATTPFNQKKFKEMTAANNKESVNSDSKPATKRTLQKLYAKGKTTQVEPKQQSSLKPNEDDKEIDTDPTDEESFSISFDRHVDLRDEKYMDDRNFELNKSEKPVFNEYFENEGEKPVVEVEKQSELKLGQDKKKVRRRKCVKTNSNTSGKILETKEDRWEAEDLNKNCFLILIKILQANETFYIKGFGNRSKIKTDQVLVLSSENTLADLRDAIICEYDFCSSIYSPDKICKEIIPSGMFYINNTFYIDKRHKGSKDYSLVVKEWGKRKGIRFGETFHMASTLIKDLGVKINFPYLYQHLGDCEHFVIIEEIRLLIPSDPRSTKKYPLVNFIGPCWPRLCATCGRNLVEYVVVGSERIPNDQLECCGACYQSFFLIGGQPIEPQLKIYPYVSRSYLLN